METVTISLGRPKVVPTALPAWQDAINVVFLNSTNYQQMIYGNDVKDNMVNCKNVSIRMGIRLYTSWTIQYTKKLQNSFWMLALFL